MRNWRLQESVLRFAGFCSKIICLTAVFGMAFVLAAPAPFGQSNRGPQYQHAVDALYNLDFSIAERDFDNLVESDPQNPNPWNGLASAMWLKILYAQQKLNMESFSGARIGTTESRDSIDSLDEKKFQNATEAAINAANKKLQANPQDADAYYALGVSNGLLASFEATTQRGLSHYLSAHARAKAAMQYDEKVLKLVPSYDDARLSIGVYDYVTSVIPAWLRFPLRLAGVGGGDKEGGIRDLETVATKGVNAATDAKMMLVFIYAREKQYPDAIRVLDELHAQYPRNFLFEMSKGSIYEKMKSLDQSADVFHHVLAQCAAHQNGYERLRPEKAYFSLAWVNVERGRLDEALAAYDKVTTGKTATTDEKAESHLWMGKILDTRNERAKAIEHYDAVLALDCDPSKKAEAMKLKASQFKGSR